MYMYIGNCFSYSDCTAGSYDINCGFSCEKCVHGVCERFEGNCTHGCIKGFKGHGCHLSGMLILIPLRSFKEYQYNRPFYSSQCLIIVSYCEL